MSFYIAVILAVVIFDYILLRFLLSALSKIVVAKMIHVFHSFHVSNILQYGKPSRRRRTVGLGFRRERDRRSKQGINDSPNDGTSQTDQKRGHTGRKTGKHRRTVEEQI